MLAGKKPLCYNKADLVRSAFLTFFWGEKQEIFGEKKRVVGSRTALNMAPNMASGMTCNTVPKGIYILPPGKEVLHMESFSAVSPETGALENAFPHPEKERKKQESRLLRKAANRTGWCLLLCVGIMSVLFLVFQVGFSALVPAEAVNPQVGLPLDLFFAVQAFSYLAAFVIPSLLLMKWLGLSPAYILPMEKAPLARSLAGICFASLICFLANFPAQWIIALEKALGFNGDIPGYPVDGTLSVQLLYFLSVAILPPLVEELLFRGVILRGLLRFGSRFAVLASASLFAVLHGNVPQMVFAFFCGLMMGLLVVKTGNIWTSVAVHFINNGFAAVSFLLIQNGQLLWAGMLSMVFFLLLLGLGIASLVFLRVRHKGFFTLEKGNSPLGAGGKLGALFGNPGVIGILLYCAYSCIVVLLQG